MDFFSEPTRQWFRASFPGPTRVQELGWPALSRGEHALLLAPTGSGKTLAAFLWALDQVFALPEEAPQGVRVLYVSPLKALVYDIERNLRAPLVGIGRAAERLGLPVRSVGVDIRTGDTPSRDRQRQRRRPAEILVTTPESLYLILGSQAAATLATVHTVIVDEVHALAPTKRGVHLALSLERLVDLCPESPQRVGLSATVRPAETVARFLGGPHQVEVIDAAGAPRLELEVIVPVADMENPPLVYKPAPVSSRISTASVGSGASVPKEKTSPVLAGLVSEESLEPKVNEGIWPSIYPQIVDAIRRHRSTLIFTNSRGLCERLAQRLNELVLGEEERDETAPPLVLAHHGSVSHERRAEIEEALKAGRLRGIVATSSLELGIDMGAIDLVVLVESPGSVASGLQRVGRAGHSVGERSRGAIYPKFRGDLLECAVTAQRMLAGELEAIRVPTNALDVLAQQVVALCCDRPRTVRELLDLVRRACPYRDLGEEPFRAVLDMLSGRYPSDDFSDLRPRLAWDRATDTLTARRGSSTLTRLNAGTIPDRGLFGVFLGSDGPRVGELDEEMVYETRAGDVILLGASSWRVLEITRDRVHVAPAPGQPGRLPFWHGEGPGRPIELGRALGAFTRRLESLSERDIEARLVDETPLDVLAARNLAAYLEEQRAHVGSWPTDKRIVIERFPDELGDWRLCILTPFGSRVHAPWALALENLLSTRAGFEVQTMYTDDGIVLRFADCDNLPSTDDLLPLPEEVEELVIEQLGSSALFASTFRENAARALLLPRQRPKRRTPLWLQRLRSGNLLALVKNFRDFPILLETYRECLQDVFDLPALIELLSALRRREIRVDDVETPSASPFARSLVFSYVARYLYDQDAPLAEKKAQALTLDRSLLRELLGQAELRELLDQAAIDEVEAELQALAEDRRARSKDEVHDLLRRLGDLTVLEIEHRSEGSRQDVLSWLDELRGEKRALPLAIADEDRWVVADDAARYRDAFGVPLPPGLPTIFLARVEEPLRSLVHRYARTHAPFSTESCARRFGVTSAVADSELRLLLAEGKLTRGEICPGGTEPEWCDIEVLRRIKRRSLARLRGEIAAVESATLGRFLPEWQGVCSLPGGSDGVCSLPVGSDGVCSLPGGSDGVTREGSTRGEVRLLEVISQLEGLPLPWSSLSRLILPSRIANFDLDLLDLLAARGLVVWVGRGALGTGDGRVALYRREHAALLIERSDTELSYEPPTELHAQVLDELVRRGACFTAEIERSLDARGPRELEQTLWDLVWAGQITNDTFLPLRSVGRRPRAVSRTALSRTDGGSSSRSLVGGLSAWGSPQARFRRHTSRPKTPALGGGRWSRVQDLIEGEPLAATERLIGRAQLLLERYGLVSRETALAEGVEGGFASLYPILQEMEESGQVRRGYFVEGLSGRQFALPGALDRLRALRRREDAPSAAEREKSRLCVVAAVDPSNVYGTLLPWPEGRPGAPRPRRVPGAWVVLVDGRLSLFVESSLKGLLTFSAFDGEELLALALQGYRQIAARLRKRSLSLEKIDGLPARDSPLATAFEAEGFSRDHRGLVWSRDAKGRTRETGSDRATSTLANS